LGDLCNVMKTSRGRVGCNSGEVQVLKQQQSKFQETARGAYEYGMGLLMAALVLRRSASLSPDKNRQLAALLGSTWNRLLAAVREQMTRLRVAGLFYRDISQHEHDLTCLVTMETADSETWGQRQSGTSDAVPDAEQVFRTLGRSVRLGRLLQRKILEPLLPGEGFDTCPENQQAVQVICNRISCVTELAHKLDCALGNNTDSFMDALEESVFDMEEIDVEVGMEEAAESGDEQPLKEDRTNTSKSSSVSCYQSASDCSYDWSRDVSPEREREGRPAVDDDAPQPAIQHLDMKPMDDFRDYVNLTPVAPPSSSQPSEKLFLYTANCTSNPLSSLSGLSPNSSEDSGFATRALWLPSADKVDASLLLKGSLLPAAGDSFGPRYRNSICYARSASCDSLF